jgi:ABC-type sugar transport system ATPase subunit
MQDLAERGLAIVMISSELPEILGMSDRIAVMHAGTVRAVVDRADASAARIMAIALAADDDEPHAAGDRGGTGAAHP